MSKTIFSGADEVDVVTRKAQLHPSTLLNPEHSLLVSGYGDTPNEELAPMLILPRCWRDKTQGSDGVLRVTASIADPENLHLVLAASVLLMAAKAALCCLNESNSDAVAVPIRMLARAIEHAEGAAVPCSSSWECVCPRCIGRRWAERIGYWNWRREAKDIEQAKRLGIAPREEKSY